MFKDAKVGDRVWSVGKGWGVIKDTKASGKYPLSVNFDTLSYYSYTFEGKATLKITIPHCFGMKSSLKFLTNPNGRLKSGLAFSSVTNTFA